MSTEKNIRIRQRVDTNSNWTSKGKLLKNEIGIDSTNKQIRLGTADNQNWNAATVLSDPRETYVEFGGKPLGGTMSPFGATLNEYTNFNVFLGAYEQVTFEYSNDDGATWETYNLPNSDKASIFGDITRYMPAVCLGGLTHASGTETADELKKDQLKITISSHDDKNNQKIYAQLKKILVWCSSLGNIITLDINFNGNKVVSNATIVGTSGWNEIPLSLSSSFGYTSSTLELIFKYQSTAGSLSSSTNKYLPSLIYQIQGYAPMSWQSPKQTTNGKGYITDFYNKKIQFNNNDIQYVDNSNGILRTSGALGVGSNQQAVMGNHSFAQGNTAKATGEDSSAMGNAATASGNFSHAQGYQTQATGACSHAEGQATLSSGQQSHAEGGGTQASANEAHAEGSFTNATAKAAHAEGANTNAEGTASHAEGCNTQAQDMFSHAEGQNTIASGYASHAEGFYNAVIFRGYSIASVIFNNGLYTLIIDGSSIDYAVGDKISVKGNFEFNPLGVISAINGATMTIKPVDGDIFSSQEFSLKTEITDTLIDGTTVNMPWENVVWCNEKITTGNSPNGASIGMHAEGLYTYAYRAGAHAEGYNNEARGFYSHAEGYGNIAEYSAHAEGHDTTASGEMSHAEGYGTVASGNKSHTEGEQTKANSEYSHAEGAYNTIDSFSPASHSEGIHNTIIDAPYSHVEGRGNTVGKDTAHAEGRETIASGENSHSEGQLTQATGTDSHVEGNNNIASGNSSHAEGNNTSATAMGAHAEGGDNTKATGDYSHAEGRTTIASNTAAHAEGYQTSAEGAYAHAEGGNTLAAGVGSHAEGINNYAYGEGAHVQGRHAIKDKTGKYAHIVGGGSWGNEKNIHTLDWSGNAFFAGSGRFYGSVTSLDGKLVSETTQSGVVGTGNGSVKFNNKTTNNASGEYSVAFNDCTSASGKGSVAMGYQTNASGWSSVAMGNACSAQGAASVSIGVDNVANGEGAFVHGTHAERDTEGKYLEIVGNGSAWGAYSNAYTLDREGNAWFAGGITVGPKAEPLRQTIEVKISATAATAESESVYMDNMDILKFYQSDSSYYTISFENRFPSSEYDINIKYNPNVLQNGDIKTSRKAFSKLKIYTANSKNNTIYVEALPTTDVGIVLEVHKK